MLWGADLLGPGQGLSLSITESLGTAVMCATVSRQYNATGPQTSITSATIFDGKAKGYSCGLSQRTNEETEGYKRLGEGVYSYTTGLCQPVVTSKSNSSSKRGKEDVYTLDFVSGT